MNPTTSSRPESRATAAQSERGSVLLVVMLLSLVIAISLTSFLQLTTHAAKMANRSFYMDAAQNLCDTGIEQALWAMNNSSNWSGAGFTQSATYEYQGTFPNTGGVAGNYTYIGKVTGRVKIWADITPTSTPHIVAKSTITLSDGSQITKAAEAYLKQGSYFDNGLVAGSITFSGSNIFVNSWNSNPDGNATTPAIPYSSAVAAANITVGATNVTPGALTDQNGKIAGYAAAGSTETGGGISINQGIIGNATYVNNSANKGTIQADHATYDFTESFPDISAPSGNITYNTLANATVPQATDVQSSDGKYYYTVSTITLTSNHAKLYIQSGNVVIKTTATTGTAVKISGSADGIVIAGNASLAIYTDQDVSISGNGVINGNASVTGAGEAKNFQLYGTRSASTGTFQDISISGNGYFSGVIYAPNGNVSMTGGGTNGDVLGAILAHKATLTGGTNFHYDEALPTEVVAGVWKVKKWRELVTDAEQAPYATKLAF